MVASLAWRAEADGMALLRALNREAMESEKSDVDSASSAAATPGQARQRMTFGIYFYCESDAGLASSAGTDAPTLPPEVPGA